MQFCALMSIFSPVVYLYDEGSKFVVSQSEGCSRRRSNGTCSFRVMGVRIVLLMTTGERLSRASVATRVSRVKEVAYGDKGGSKYAPYEKALRERPSIRASTPKLSAEIRSRLRELPTASEEIRLDYLVENEPGKEGYTFKFLRSSSLVTTASLHPEMRRYRVEGDSFSNMKLVFRTPWLFSRTFNVSVQALGHLAWTLEPLMPPGSDGHYKEWRLLSIPFPEGAVKYIAGLEPGCA